MSGPHRPPLHPRLIVPPGYSHHYERRAELRDGRVVDLRPIVPDDLDELRIAVAEADAGTLHNRFLGGRPPSTEEEFRHLVHVDYDRRFAVVALSPSRRGVGLARYEAEEGSSRAEVAVAVAPGWRRVGLAKALLRLLGEAALDHGIATFTMVFVVDNLDVASILQESHLPVLRHSAEGVVDAEVDLAAVERELGLQLPPASR
jgi:GNAT superfamily N-acetyltransferase